MRSRFRSSVTLAFTLLVTLAACAGEPPPEPAPRPVLVTRPGAPAAASSSFAGEVRAREESPLAFRVGGKLLERRVDVGDHVRAGDVLAVLDGGDLQAQARAAQARLSAAQAELGRARADQARFAELAREQLVSRSTLDAHNAAAVAAQGQVDAARADLDLAGNQLGHGQLRAPADGVIAGREAEAGQVVGAGQTIFTLAADGPREIAFSLPEGAHGVELGQLVQVTLWSQPGRSWPGRIRELAPAADPASRTFAARATVEAPGATLQLGQSARVHLPGDSAAALSLPLPALQRSGSTVAVFVVDPATSTLKLQPVRVARHGSDQVAISEGIGADDWVVAAGGHLLRAGQKVTPVDRDNRAIDL